MIKPQTREHDLIEVPVLIDRERLLRLDSYAMERILDESGKNIMRGEFVPATFKDFALFIWGCAQTDAVDPISEGGCDTPLTLEMVLDSTFIHQFREVVEVVTKLMGGADKDPDSLAPYVASDLFLIQKGLEIAGLKKGEKFWDLGCGDGRALAFAARMGADVYGVENEPNRAKLARALLKRQAVPEDHVVIGKIQETDFSNADVIFTYLQTPAYEVLGPMFLETLKPGTRILSHDFQILKWIPMKQIQISVQGDRRPHSLYLYEVGKSEVMRGNDGVITDAEAEIVADDITASIDQYFAQIGEGTSAENQ